MIPTEFGQRFKAARLKAGLTQVAAAERLGIPQPRIAEYETGGVVPPLPRLMEIMATLGLDPKIVFPEFFKSTRPRR